MDPALPSPVGQGAAQCRNDHLLWSALRVVARLRSMDCAAADELGRTPRALTSAAGALLTPWLAATTAYLATALGGMGALAGCRKLCGNDLVNQGNVRGYVEKFGRQVRGAGLVAFRIKHIDGTRLAHAATPLLA